MRLREALRTAGVVARNLALGGNLAAISLLGRPRRMVHYVSESLFLYRALGGRRGIPERSVQDALGNGRQVTDVRLGRVHGDSWLEGPGSYAADLVALCMICRLLEPRLVFEIGTLHGYTAYHLALNTPEDALIYTLDLPKDGALKPALPTTMVDDAHVRAWRRTASLCFEGAECENKIRTLEGDSATFDFKPFHERVDLFFIDGAHSYEYVRSDTERAMTCTRAGGVIAWHDFGRAGVNGVSRRLRELRREGHEPWAVPGGSLAFMVKRPAEPAARQDPALVERASADLR